MREPALTLMSVEKPWMLSAPGDSMSQMLESVPGLLFSHAMALPPEPHGSVAALALAATAARPASMRIRPSTRMPTWRTPCRERGVAIPENGCPSRTWAGLSDFLMAADLAHR